MRRWNDIETDACRGACERLGVEMASAGRVGRRATAAMVAGSLHSSMNALLA